MFQVSLVFCETEMPKLCVKIKQYWTEPELVILSEQVLASNWQQQSFKRQRGLECTKSNFALPIFC